MLLFFCYLPVQIQKQRMITARARRKMKRSQRWESLLIRLKTK